MYLVLEVQSKQVFDCYISSQRAQTPGKKYSYILVAFDLQDVLISFWFVALYIVHLITRTVIKEEIIRKVYQYYFLYRKTCFLKTDYFLQISMICIQCCRIHLNQCSCWLEKRWRKIRDNGGQDRKKEQPGDPERCHNQCNCIRFCNIM